MKKVSITFDYEGSWGMPHTAPYDLPTTTDRLLETLARHQARAVFFVSSKLIGEYPATIKKLHEHGHEVGFHGYLHEHMHQLSEPELAALSQNLAHTATELKQLIGYTPKGFRAPYLMGPIFYVPAVYQALADQGFSWISNREIRMPEELFRPGRLPLGMKLLLYPAIRKPLLAALNPNILTKEHPQVKDGHISGLNWLLGNQDPFLRPEGLVEYPLTSPLDCDLVGLPLPNEISGAKLTAYATTVINRCFDLSSTYFNVNCHDWIMGSADRLQILSDVLAHINTHPDVSYYLPGLDPHSKRSS